MKSNQKPNSPQLYLILNFKVDNLIYRSNDLFIKTIFFIFTFFKYEQSTSSKKEKLRAIYYLINVIIEMLPWENVADDGASGWASGDETFPTAETSSDEVKENLIYKKEGEGNKSVEGGSIGGVNADSSVVVGKLFRLKR
jgi:hypothetical protein